ncbi:MAG: hypothetical protein D6720_05555 [Gammaproteobacteria bacterium]|nr:MAG: hypothetical protein D6720_05555 [Gammaproteobacteria bacterium]
MAKARDILALGLVLATGTVAAQVQCISTVDSHGDRALVEQGDFRASVNWQNTSLQPTTIGYGSAARRAYELTVDQGRVFMVRPKGEGFEVRHDPRPDEGAVMLQLASPSKWQPVTQLDEISTFDDLAFLLDELLEEIDCGEDAVLPFRIEGHIQAATWSLDTRPVNHVGHAGPQQAAIVGIYSRHDKKRLFMVPGYNLHAHIVLKGDGFAGHLRDLQLTEGAILYLPAQRD